MVTMFAEYCTAPFEVEPVQVVDAAGQSAGALGLHCATVYILLHELHCRYGWSWLRQATFPELNGLTIPCLERCPAVIPGSFLT